MLLLSVAIAFLVIYVVTYFRRISRYPPGPLPLPLIGNLLLLNVKYPHKAIDKIGKKYGNVFTLWLPLPTVIITGLEEMKEALIAKGDNFSGRPSTPTDSFFLNVPNGGIIFSQGQEWKEQRSFALSVLRSFGVGSSVIEDMVHRSLDELFEHLETLVSSDIVTVRLPSPPLIPTTGGFFQPCLSPPCGPPPCFNPPCNFPPPCFNPPCGPIFGPPLCLSPPCFAPAPIIIPPPPCFNPPCGPIFGHPPCLFPPCFPPPPIACINPPCGCISPPCGPVFNPPIILPAPSPIIIQQPAPLCASPPCFPPPPIVVQQAPICSSSPCAAPAPPPVLVKQTSPCSAPPCSSCSGPSCSKVAAPVAPTIKMLARDDPMRDMFAAYFKQYFAGQAGLQQTAPSSPLQNGRIAASQQVTIPLMKDGVVTQVPAQLEVIVNQKKKA